MQYQDSSVPNSSPFIPRRHTDDGLCIAGDIYTTRFRIFAEHQLPYEQPLVTSSVRSTNECHRLCLKISQCSYLAIRNGGNQDVTCHLYSSRLPCLAKETVERVKIYRRVADWKEIHKDTLIYIDLISCNCFWNNHHFSTVSLRILHSRCKQDRYVQTDTMDTLTHRKKFHLFFVPRWTYQARDLCDIGRSKAGQMGGQTDRLMNSWTKWS